MPKNFSHLPLQNLQVFAVAARCLSFTAAAQELRTSQPAVSQQIRALEDFLGQTLFTRIYRGVELTEAGKILFEAVTNGLQTIQSTVTELKQQQQSPHINVATDYAFAAFWLLPRLPDFRKLHPEVDIRFQTTQFGSGYNSSDLDLAVHFGDGQFRNNQTTLLFRERVFPVYNPRVLGPTGSVSSLADLVRLPLLKLYAEQEQPWLNWNTYFKALKGKESRAHSELEFNNYTLLIQAAIAGQGVALGWGHLVDDLLEQGYLKAMPEFTVTTEQGYFITLTRQEKPSEITELFFEWLLEQAEGSR